MEQTTVAIAAAIIVGCASIIIAFLTKIAPRFNDCIKQRKTQLDNNFVEEINKTERKATSIDPFLPFFKENEDIRDWREKRNSITDHTFFTFAFTVSGFVSGLLNINLNSPVSLDELLVASGGFFFLLMIYRMLNLHKKMQEWQEKECKS